MPPLLVLLPLPAFPSILFHFPLLSSASGAEPRAPSLEASSKAQILPCKRFLPISRAMNQIGRSARLALTSSALVPQLEESEESRQQAHQSTAQYDKTSASPTWRTRCRRGPWGALGGSSLESSEVRQASQRRVGVARLGLVRSCSAVGTRREGRRARKESRGKEKKAGRTRRERADTHPEPTPKQSRRGGTCTA